MSALIAPALATSDPKADAIRETEQKQNTVLIIDDQATGRAILEQVVKSIDTRISTASFANPVEALDWANSNTADLVLVDYLMPQLNGLEVAKRLRRLQDFRFVPIVMVTIYDERKVRYDALDAGVTDFLTKPIDAHECLARCRNLLTLRRQYLALNERREILREMVVDATRENAERERETIFALARAAESRGAETDNHLRRVSRYSAAIAQALSLPSDEREVLETAAQLHDVGKVGLSASIFAKGTRLSPQETDALHQHPIIGYELLKDCSSKYLQMGALISLGHHERFDGRGYPYGRRGTDIPRCARIVAVADVLDALTSNKPVHDGTSIDEAIAFLRSHSGTWFDPAIVESLSTIRDSIESTLRALPDNSP